LKEISTAPAGAGIISTVYEAASLVAIPFVLAPEPPQPVRVAATAAMRKDERNNDFLNFAFM
jgi:hypothetical protein